MINLKYNFEDLKSYIENFEKSKVSYKCSESPANELIEGNFDKVGYHGKVIIRDDKAYKFNTADIDNNETTYVGKTIFADRILLQNMINIMINVSVSKNVPWLSNTYQQFIDMYKCNSGIISVYSECNGGTLSEFLDQNKENPDKIDRYLVMCIQQMSSIISYLNKKHKFIHNDLKANNVMLHYPENNDNVVFKMIDFDSSYIVWNDAILTGPWESVTGFNDFPHEKISCGKDMFRIRRRSPPGVYEGEGFIFRNTYNKSINIDIYTLLISIIFHRSVVYNIENLPLFNSLCSYIFTEYDLSTISRTMKGLKKWHPRVGIYGPIHYLIYYQFRIKNKVHEIIEEISKELLEIK